MLRDFEAERQQLDGLAAELIEAGRISRTETARRELPDPRFAISLRASLLDQFAQRRTTDGLAPVPPTRPLGWVGPERRAVGRSVAGPRPEWADRQEFLGVAAVEREDARPESGRRWEQAPAGLPQTAVGEETEAAAHVAVLRPAVRWHMPVRVMPARWVAVGLAASLAIASLMYGTVQLFPSSPTATAEVVVGATVTRGGVTSSLVVGEELKPGDTIEVAQGGNATIALGDSFIRMASASSLRLDGLDPNHVLVSQLAGRAYHRVSVDEDGDYTVMTGPVKWTAAGTAFDIDRYPWGADGEEVRGLALLDDLRLTSPDLSRSLDQGQSATIRLSGADELADDPSLGSITADTLADAWLILNAQLDHLAGLDLGELAVLVTPSPVATRTEGPLPTEPPATTPAPTPKPTPRPTPRPTQAAPVNLGNLSVAYDAESGKYTLGWSKYTGAWTTGKTHYKLLYEPWGTTPSYGTSDWWASLESRTERSWTGEIPNGDYAVRVQVIDESSGTVVRAQTGVLHLKTLPPTASLGGLSADISVPGQVTFSWTGYSGGWPYSYYKLVYGPPGSNPSYLAGASYLAVPSAGQTSVTIEIGAEGFAAGTELDLRIQAIGYPYGSGYAFGQTSVLTFTVPVPSA